MPNKDRHDTIYNTPSPSRDLVIPLVLSLAVLRDLGVVPLEPRQVLPSFGELALLHALPHVPVHEGALAPHGVELGVETAEEPGRGSGVGDQRHRAPRRRQVATGHAARRLPADAELEPGRAPRHEPYRSARAQRRHGRIYLVKPANLLLFLVEKNLRANERSMKRIIG